MYDTKDKCLNYKWALVSKHSRAYLSKINITGNLTLEFSSDFVRHIKSFCVSCAANFKGKKSGR